MPRQSTTPQRTISTRRVTEAEQPVTFGEPGIPPIIRSSTVLPSTTRVTATKRKSTRTVVEGAGIPPVNHLSKFRMMI
jgi:hypothetical protein